MKSSSNTLRTSLDRAFYARETALVARQLLGNLLVSTVAGKRVEGRIVETEAYLGPHDPASHAAERIGRTQRNASMFGPPGIAYIYRIYGVHWCLNVVTMQEDFPAAVLIRAIEPLRGLDTMRQRRWPAGHAGPDHSIASGPGKLAAALGITGELDGHDLRKSPLFLMPDSVIAEDEIVCGPRIGITRALDWPLRFRVSGNPWVSRA
ncbi:MAG: DNA-3-methyladenine glycosylase [Longimicrobiales bacterium]